MNGHTSQRQADELARSLEPGQMARLTRGIWLRRSLDGRHRYVVSVRGAGRGARVHHATHDTLLAALDDRDMAVGRRAQERRAAGGRPRAGSNPGMETLSTHLRRSYRSWAQTHLEPSTLFDYEGTLQRLDAGLPAEDAERVIALRGVADPFEQRIVAEGLGWLPLAEIRPRDIRLLAEACQTASQQRIRERKTSVYERRLIEAATRRIAPPPPPAFSDAASVHKKLITVARSVFEVAVQDGTLETNAAGSVAHIKAHKATRGTIDPRSDLPLLNEVERIRLAFADSDPLIVARDRAIVSVSYIQGPRPSEMSAWRFADVITPQGPREWVRVQRAIQRSEDGPHEGPTKTHRNRMLPLWPIVGAELYELWIARGKPALSERVFATRAGTPMDWENWRERIWYETLFRAGVAEGPWHDAAGAFDPYLLRALSVSLHLALKSGLESGSGPNQPFFVAEWHGHTLPVMASKYARMSPELQRLRSLTVEEAVLLARKEAQAHLAARGGPGEDGP